MKKLSKMHQRMQAGKLRTPLGKVPEAAAVEPVSPTRPKVIFMGRDLATTYPFATGDVVISISDTHACAPKFVYQPEDLLVLSFHDEVTFREEEALGYRWMMPDQAKQVVEFMQKNNEKQNIVIHCNYGQSRSKAVACFIRKMTARQIFYADAFGRIVPYTDSDRGNRRVYDLLMMAHLEHIELNG